jgi:DNA-binding Lrp family transcriptional regulator
MRKRSCTDQEFIGLWNKHGSVVELSKILGITERNVNARRRKIEEKHGIILAGVARNSPDFKVTYPENNIRVNVTLKNGVIVVGSDCHYWPGIISTAHRAFVKIIKEIKPRMVVMNGDVFDGASISRHPVSGWGTTPTVKQELEACQERLKEVEKAARGSALHWTWGNHDMRFNARLAAQVGDTWRGVEGMNLTDHFPMWKFSTSIMVNETIQIKHRLYNGIHAAYNATLKSGISTVNGHLHSLKVTPWTDLTGTRYGVDTGSLANVWGDQFEYTEDSTRNHRSGFAVLTFIDGKLMPPELVEVMNEDAGEVYFRGELIKV